MPTQLSSAVAAAPQQRLRMVIRGAVQGVGFRPFVFRLASELGLNGWVSNTSAGVFLEVEGPEQRVREFQRRVERDKPAIAFIQSMESSLLDAAGFETFEIRESSGGEKTVLVMPDIATCPECLADITDPNNRRFGYPFTNCTNCGPRFTIIEALPYDRPSTTMKKFPMCPDCEREYLDPANRRFHAQPNACPNCGPKLEYWDESGTKLADQNDSLALTARAIRDGKVVAVKGIGGFHLIADARNYETVAKLRERKRREEKPFALMYASLDAVLRDCELSELEERLLRAPEAPIVLLKKLARSQSGLTETVAPRNPYLGVMLPYTPLHHLLIRELHFPVVATSGNLSDEPICTDEWEAVERLRGIADAFLVHDRPIVRHVDDSIVRVVAGRELVIRRARGFAPLPAHVKAELPPVLGVGAHQKNAIAASVGQQVFVSQHIGDLETQEASQAFDRVIENFKSLYEFSPKAVACDLHPNYMSTEYAQKSGLPTIAVQHHYAHVLSCMAENELDAPVLGIAWDGSGYGPDGMVWGGEFLRVSETGYERVAHLRTFRLPGSEKAVKEPRRSGLGALYEIFGDETMSQDVASVQSFGVFDQKALAAMLRSGLNSPRTSSAGRLFDAVASLLDLRQTVRNEGQAAMELEALASTVDSDEEYSFAVLGDLEPFVVDWEPMVHDILREIRLGEAKTVIARRFHNTLASMMVAVAEKVYASREDEPRVGLTGGCFQNRLLTETSIRMLSEAGFRVYWHQRIPPNDGGIALGQIMAAARHLRAAKE